MYLGYAVWSMHYMVLVHFVLVWIFLFLPNWLTKEASMRYV